MDRVTGGPGAPVLAAADRAAALAEVKAQLRHDGGADDVLIGALAETALGLAEQFVGRALIVREMVATMAPAHGWRRLPAGPVRAITAVAVAGVALPGASYAIDIDAGGIGWVKAASDVVLTVTFSAGDAAGWVQLPVAIRQGVAVLAAHLFTDRDGRQPPPAAVTALWRPHREVRLNLAAHA
jgi:uncharacterized phiE125 gp8 family phage protein